MNLRGALRRAEKRARQEVIWAAAAAPEAATLNEQIDDRVAALLTAGANITLTYNDAANTLTIAASGGGGGGSGYFPGGW